MVSRPRTPPPSGDILDDFERNRRPRYPVAEARRGLVVEDRASGFCGDVVTCTAQSVTLRDRHGSERTFVLKDGGFLLDGAAITLRRPASPAASAGTASVPAVTNSGSVASPRPPRAQVARASRIWVEGVHDAELLEHVWGDDLREAGIVVEPMHGLDDIVAAVADFAPGAHRRLGVLVDHLVDGSKEHRLAVAVARLPEARHVLVTGHPFVDVWAGVRPDRLGLAAWPEVPRSVPWKQGICAALGQPADAEGVRGCWRVIRSKVKTYADLRPELVGAVEQLIDFVAVPPADG